MTTRTTEITEIDLFDLPQEEIPIEEIDIVLSGMGESMDHGCTRTMSEACLMATPKMLAEQMTRNPQLQC